MNIAINRTGFTGGEISKRLLGRVDIEQYYKSAKICHNFIVTDKGELEKRQGFLFVANTKNNGNAKLLEFSPRIKNNVFGDQFFLIEAGDFYFRFYQNNVMVFELETPYSIQEVEEFDYVASIDYLWIAHKNHPLKVITQDSVNSFSINDWQYDVAPMNTINTDRNKKLKLDGSVDGTFLGVLGGTLASYTLVSQPSQPELQELAIGDEIIFSGDVVGGFVLPRRKVTIVDYIDNSFIVEGETILVSSETIGETSDFTVNGQPIADVGGVQQTAGVTWDRKREGTGVLTANFNAFSPEDVGRQIRIKRTYFENDVLFFEWVTVTITGYISETEVQTNYTGEDDVKIDFTEEWQVSSFYEGNYPHRICIHERRLVLANTTDGPQKVWMSRTDNFSSFEESQRTGEALGISVIDSDGISFSVESDGITEISWLSSSDILTVGTPTHIFKVQSSTLSEAITTRNVTARAVEQNGSDDHKPEVVNNITIYFDRSKKKLKGIYREDEVNYSSIEISELAEHIYDVTMLKDITYQEFPYSVVWTCQDNGELTGCTFKKTTGFRCFHRHSLGGNGKVESVQSIKSGDRRNSDTLYAIVNRGGKRTIEFLSEYWKNDSEYENSTYLDNSVRKTFSTPQSIITGLENLNGISVKVIVDGVFIDKDFIVSNGSLDISPNAGSNVLIGIGYESLYETVDIETQLKIGSSQGQAKKIYRSSTRVFRSYPFEKGERRGDNSIIFRDIRFGLAGDLRDEPQYPFTGRFDIQAVETGYSYADDVTFILRQAKPYPLVVSSLVVKLASSLSER